MNPLFENAIDSLEVGMKFYLDSSENSTRKHSILTIFHSIELLLKECLFQINPILIYKNIDKEIREDSITVGIREIIARLENLDLGLQKEEMQIIEKIQIRRNQIEHHRYDHLKEDEEVIAESLKFILYFLEFRLEVRASDFIDAKLLEKVNRIVIAYNERTGLAIYRLHTWFEKEWPEWNIENQDSPDEFEGTLECPVCGQGYLVIDRLQIPICFWCNAEVDAFECEECCQVKLRGEECCD